jgi:Ca-activated chloride channel family protein
MNSGYLLALALLAPMALPSSTPSSAPALSQKLATQYYAEPSNLVLAYNLGGALYQEQKFEEAARHFLTASNSEDVSLRADAFRHYGDSLFRQQKTNEAVTAYAEALYWNPSDEVARHNLEVALSQQQAPQSQQSQNQEQNQEQQEQQKQEQQQNQEQQEQKNQEQQEQKQEQQNQQANGQDSKESEEKKQEQQGTQGSEEKKEQEQQAQNSEEKKQEEAKQQQASVAKKPAPEKSKTDKLLDALQSQEKSFLQQKMLRGRTQPRRVEKDW